MKKIIAPLKNSKGAGIISWVIIAAMVAVIALGVVNAWKDPIKDLNSAATARLIITN